MATQKKSTTPKKTAAKKTTAKKPKPKPEQPSDRYGEAKDALDWKAEQELQQDQDNKAKYEASRKLQEAAKDLAKKTGNPVTIVHGTHDEPKKPVFNIDAVPSHDMAIKNDEVIVSIGAHKTMDERLSDGVHESAQIKRLIDVDYLQLFTDAKHALVATDAEEQQFVADLVRPGPNDDPDMMLARWEAMREQTPIFADTLLGMCDGEWAKEAEAHTPDGEEFNLVVDGYIDYSPARTLLTIWGGSH